MANILPSTQSVVSSQENFKYRDVWQSARKKLRVSTLIRQQTQNISNENPITPHNNTIQKVYSIDYAFKRSPSRNDLIQVEQTEHTPLLMFHPNKSAKSNWNIVVAILLIYTATVMPYSMAFVHSEQWDAWFILDLIIDCLFFLDVIVNCLTAYYDASGLLVTSYRQVFWKYLKTWMLVDIIACIPFGLIDSSDDDSQSGQSSGGYNNFLRLIRLPRLYRLFRVSRILKMFKHYKNNELLEKLQDLLSIKHSAMRLCGSLITILICIHIVSCFWYFSARLEGFHPDTWVMREGYMDQDEGSLYITCVYWAITTMSTVGYGDISAYTDLEKLISIFWMLFGLYFLSFTIGSLTSILNHIDTKENVLLNKLAMIDEFAKESNLSRELQHKLRHALRYSTEKAGFSWNDKQNIFEELPKPLRYEVALAMHHGVVKEIEFFKDKDPVFVAAIVPFLQHMFVEDSIPIYKRHEYADEIYFIIKGKVNIRPTKSNQNLVTFHRGEYFGDVEVVKQCPRQYQAVASRDCELLILNKTLIKIIFNDFPAIWYNLINEAEKRDRQLTKTKLELKEIAKLRKKGFQGFSKSTVKQLQTRINQKAQRIEQRQHSNYHRNSILENDSNLSVKIDNLTNIVCMLSENVNQLWDLKVINQNQEMESFSNPIRESHDQINLIQQPQIHKIRSHQNILEQKQTELRANEIQPPLSFESFNQKIPLKRGSIDWTYNRIQPKKLLSKRATLDYTNTDSNQNLLQNSDSGTLKWSQSFSMPNWQVNNPNIPMNNTYLTNQVIDQYNPNNIPSSDDSSDSSSSNIEAPIY